MKVHTIDGKQYVEVGRKAEVGEKVIIIDDKTIPDHNGKIGVVMFTYDDGVSVDVNESIDYYPFVFEGEYRVLEPIDSEDDLVTASADNPDQIIELLGNLARRVTELEQRVSQSGEKFTAKQVAEIIKALGVGAND